MRGAAYNTAEKLREALDKAERQLRRPAGDNTTIELHPFDIQVRPELFQPREFSVGLRATDKEHVQRLVRAVDIHGELDSIVVIQLGKKFVCVDGHHRLEAYKKQKWKERIKCEWFNGTVKEAVDESVARNAKDRLNVPPADRLEAAWKRVLLEWGSKAQIVKLCGVGDGTVAQMRRVMEHWRKQDELGKEFRKNLGGFELYETSWAKAKLAWLGVGSREIEDEQKAQTLARRIRSRLTNLLSRDSKVTARALALYDPELPKRLTEAWQMPNPVSSVVKERDEGETKRQKPPGELRTTDGERTAALTWAEGAEKDLPST